ncbi:MAG: polysaccharide biosynthesis protein [Deltaproteobacteria bacterium]|nr:polysaccharide biosynthesis protein [Deltaproteobacteria bacterium]
MDYYEHQEAHHANTYQLIARAGAVIIALTLVDKGMALVKEVLMAHRFGIAASLDVYNLAYALPGLTMLMFTGAFVASFVPLYIEWSNRSSATQANARALALFYMSILFFGILALAVYMLSPFIFPAMGYGLDANQKTLGIGIEKLLSVLLLIDGASIILTGLLHARKDFVGLHVAPISVNFVSIVLLLCCRQMGIYVLAWGMVLGTLGKFLYMGFSLHRSGFRFLDKVALDKSEINTFLLLALPLLGGQLIANSNVLVDQMMATQLPPGSVSTLRYAYRINDLPTQVVIIALSRAIFPFISEAAAVGNFDDLRNIFKYSIIFLGFVTFPITCLVGLFADDIVAVLLQRGAFDGHAAEQTAKALVLYCSGLSFQAYTYVNGTFFAAMKNTMPLFVMGLVSIGLNFGFNLMFMHFLGVAGIALSTTAVSVVVTLVFLVLLKRRLMITDLSDLYHSLSRLLMAVACMFVMGYLALKLMGNLGISRYVYFPTITVLICSCYLGIIWLFKTRDLGVCFETVWGTIKNLKGRPHYG